MMFVGQFSSIVLAGSHVCPTFADEITETNTSFFSKARDQEEESGASPAKSGRSLQHKTNLRLRSLWNSLDIGLVIRETRYAQHADGKLQKIPTR
jgi:hypothetical protein